MCQENIALSRLALLIGSLMTSMLPIWIWDYRDVV